MALVHMGFVHAVLLDRAEGRDGSSWDRERRLADRLVETTSRLDDLFEPAFPEESVPPTPKPPRSGLGGLLGVVTGLFERVAPAH